MEINLLNTSQGLIPLYDEDYDSKKKLKIGIIYRVKVKVARNILLHRKYFSLINLTWEYLTEEKQQIYNNSIKGFRKTIEIAAGYFTPIYNETTKEYTQTPISIAFDKMDNIAFQALYESVKNVIYAVYLKDINQEEFNKILESFE